MKRHYSDGDTVVAIVNPNTRIDIMQVRSVLGQFLPDGVNLRIYETRRDVSTYELAKSVTQDADGVIACGGDGTVSEVAAAVIGRDIPIGIVPGGSTNIVSQELRIPTGVQAAVALAFGPFDIHVMDVGTCNGKLFLHMAGTGLDARIFETTDEALKRRIGWMAYVPPAMKAVFESTNTFEITIDDEQLTVQSPLVLIANGSSVISSSFRIDESIRSDDGFLDVMVVTAKRAHELAAVMARAANPLAELRKSPWVTLRKAKRITLSSERPQSIQLDGDVMDTTPAEFGILPAAIRFSIPGPPMS